ncbi:MAG: hypothetical protein M3499_01335 [Actinomycetota bacterium]|nr:hypothetical protein [Actinomycetota bacterium]
MIRPTRALAAELDDDAGGSDFESTLGRIPASALEGDGDSSPELYYSDMAIRWRQLDLFVTRG